MAKLKVVFYAINGTGLGHITRLNNIAKELRWLLDEMGVSHQIEFLTTSDAPQVASDFLVTKIPSKTTIKEMGYSIKEYSARARLMIGNCLSMIRPDILVLDTTPQGSFNEFSFLKDFARQTVFIERHRDEQTVVDRIYHTHLKLYDLIISPETEETANKHSSEIINTKRVLVGKISGFSEREALSYQEVRELFSIKEGEKFVYVSAGGGGDKQAENDLKRIIRCLSLQSDTKILVGNGPLYQGWKCYAPNIINFSEPNISKYFHGFDYAVAAAGYNTFEELLSAKVPTLFYSQSKGLDRQDLRILNGKENNWNDYIADIHGNELEFKINEFVLGDKRAIITKSLANREQPNGRMNAAIEILKMCAKKENSFINEKMISFVLSEKKSNLVYLKSAI